MMPLDVGLGYSASDSFSVPQSTFAGVVFNFGSAGDIGDDFSGYSQTSDATATSAASGKGGVMQDANPDARINATPLVGVASNPVFIIAAAVVAVAAIGAYIYINRP